MEEDLEHVDWAFGGRVHNWRTHVSEGVRGIWSTLTPPQREAIYRQAEEAASAEEWE